MSRSFLSRPVVRRFLSNLGPFIFYGGLALVSAWGTWEAGSQSAGAVVCGALTLLFTSIVAQEVRYCLTGIHAVHRR